jgi:hypothetical protein
MLRLGTAIGAIVITLGVVTKASAALPKAGQLYTGYTNVGTYNGFSAPVSFKVARNGKQLLSFTWAGGGCVGMGGPGDPYTNPGLIYQVRTINVARNGTFSIKNWKWKSPVKQGRSFRVTTSTVRGRFTTSSKATGTITFSMKLAKTCSGKVNFVAVLGPAPGGFRKTAPAKGATVKSTSPTISWTASRHATSYRYCVSTTADTCKRWISTHSATHAALSGLSPGRTYYWQVLASSVHGSVAANTGDWFPFTVLSPGVTPRAGRWQSTMLSGAYGGGLLTVTGIGFTVGGSSVSGFGFSYDYSNGFGVAPCGSGSGSSYPVSAPASPIVNGRFSAPGGATGPWSGKGSGTFDGTFDSPTSAHGTASFFWTLLGDGLHCFTMSNTNGPFNWTATYVR